VLDAEALEEFKSRVVWALGEDSRAVEMEIVSQSNAGDLAQIVDTLIDFNDADFVVGSYDVATKLADAQTRRDIPGGIVAVFTGTHGANATRFLGIIKADIYTAYKKTENPQTNEISLELVKEALLTPATKLYKTAGFFERPNLDQDIEDLNEKWEVYVSDYQVNPVAGKEAAKYFYSIFLGCNHPASSAKTTREFYTHTTEYIRELDVDEDRRTNLYNGLNSYLKATVSVTASTRDFAEQYLEPEHHDNYRNYMVDQGVPNTAFAKDLAHIEKQLNKRIVKFRRKIKITAPSDVFEEMVEIEEIDGERDETGAIPKWTRVTIKDSVLDQE
jgi:hypothetical protein